VADIFETVLIVATRVTRPLPAFDVLVADPRGAAVICSCHVKHQCHIQGPVLQFRSHISDAEHDCGRVLVFDFNIGGALQPNNLRSPAARNSGCVGQGQGDEAANKFRQNSFSQISSGRWELDSV
jgi:hypothetical protein